MNYCTCNTPNKNCFICRKLTKEKQMEYEFIPGATITITEVCNSKATHQEFIRFALYWNKKGYTRNGKIPVDKKLLAYCSTECFVDWLIEIGKLKKAKKFQPFTLEIPINSPEEYWEVWHRLNAHHRHFEIYRNKLIKNSVEPLEDLTHIHFDSKNSHKLWKYVDRDKEKAYGKN